MLFRSVDLNELVEFGFIEVEVSENQPLHNAEHDASKMLQTVERVADTEREGEREQRRGEERESKAENSVSVDVISIFDYWSSVMGKTSSTRLTDKRKAKIKQRLKNYTVDDIKKAIDGCSKSSHHMGGNDSGTVYDDLTLICRSDDDLERFRDTIAKVDPRQIKQQSQDNTDDFVKMAMAAQSPDPFSMTPDDGQLTISDTYGQ